MYEANLKRRLNKLLFLDSTIFGGLKVKVKSNIYKTTYIVNDKCIKCKLMDCIEVCPVDCFYEDKICL